MSKIYQQGFLYSLGRKYILWVFKQYYSEVTITGSENIPGHGEPVIFAANHLNALMDSLAVLSLPPNNKAKVYLSRADLFNLNPLIVRFLRFAKLMPAYRIRDGYENLGKNKESFNEADEVLLNDACMVIMPEGNQGEEKRIRTLVKGIFRIAFNAQGKMPEGKSVKIVPVGIDMGDLIKFGKHLIIQIGTPISVGDYMHDYADNPAKAINQIKDDLRNRMEQLIPILETDQYYESFQVAVEVCKSTYLSNNNLADNTLNRFEAEKELAKKLLKIEKLHPETMETLHETCTQYRNLLDKTKLRTSNLEKSFPTKAQLFSFTLKTILLNIVAIPGYLFNILPFTIPTMVPGWLKIEYSGFISSIRYGASLICFPVFYILQAILLINLLALPGWSFVFLIPVQYFWGKLTYQAFKDYKQLSALLRLSRIIKKAPETLSELDTMNKTILKTVMHT